MKMLKELIPYIVIVIVVVLIRTFLVTPVIVDGKSMDPTLKDNQVLLLKKYDKKISRFDIVVVKVDGKKLVKRIVGLPGDHIQFLDNVLYLNDTIVEEKYVSSITGDFDTDIFGGTSIPDEYYFVLGDNRSDSLDSRIIGYIHKKQILGTTDFSLFPFSRFGTIK